MTKKSTDPLDQNVGVRVLAEAMGRTVRRVQQLAKDGVIERKARGQYHLGDSIRAYIDYLQKVVEKQGSGTSQEELKNSRSRYLDAKARDAEIEVQKKEATVIEIEQVAIVLNEVMVIISGGLESIGGRTANQLAGMTDPALIRAKLLEETRSIRTAAADRLAAIAVIGDGKRDTQTTTDKKPGSVGKRKKKTTTRKRRTRAVAK